MSCSVCYRHITCIECCGQKFCLMDFFGSLHRSHFEKAKITDTEQFNKDIDICKRLKKEIEKSVLNDIKLLDEENNKGSILLSRQHADNKQYWDMTTETSEKESPYMDMKKLPLPPSINRKEGDSIPVLMTKMITRSLRYRYQYLPQPVKTAVLNYYKEHNPLYDEMNCSDDLIFDRELPSIIGQIVSVVLNKFNRGELSSDASFQIQDYIRELDFNILKCDDVEIIRKILMKEVLDITEVSFADYFSYNKNLNISDGILKDQRQVVEKICSKCGHSKMLRLLVKGYVPVSTHDEIWVNKDSTDYLVEFECEKCGYNYRTDNPLE